MSLTEEEQRRRVRWWLMLSPRQRIRVADLYESKPGRPTWPPARYEPILALSDDEFDCLVDMVTLNMMVNG